MSGVRLLAFARAWFAEEFVATVFEPLIADWQREHDARRGVARVRSVLRLWTSFTTTTALMMPWQLKQRLPERVTLSGWIATEAFVVAGVVAQWCLFFDAARIGARNLLPALLAVALPAALLPAAAVVSRFGTPIEARTMMLRLMLLSILLLAPTLGWWLPRGNQAWRVAQRPAHEIVLRGNREVTLPELFQSQRPADVFHNRTTSWATLRRDIALERLSIWLMPMPMTLAGLAAAAALRRRHLVIVAFGTWALGAWIWLALLDLSPWMAHAVLLAAAIGFHGYDRRSIALAR